MQSTFRGAPKHLELERRIGKIDYLILQIDSKCPHGCEYCFVGEGLNKNPDGGNLSLERRMGLVKEASDLVARVVAMPGVGEPLATPKIEELIMFITSLGMISIVYSKGMLVNRKICDFLAEQDTTVILSIDSLYRETALRLNPNPRGWFERAMANVGYIRERFVPLAETIGEYRVHRLAVNHMINRMNYGQQDEIRNWCGEDILFVAHGPSREGHAIRIWDKLAGTLKEHASLIAYANKISETGGNTTARLDGKCAYYLNGITVSDNGDVKMCPAATKTAGLIGNAKNQSLTELFDLTQLIVLSKYGNNPPPCLVRDIGYGSLAGQLLQHRTL